MLYLQDPSSDASPKAISGRTSYLRVRLEFLRYPHLITTLFNGCVFGPPMPFTASSSWTWVGHPVSGLPELTLCPIKTRFPFGSVPKVLNLASPGNSPDRSTKSTRSHFVVLPQLVNTGFQVLFHSPPGVLFTFPSRYWFTIGHYLVFSLSQWSAYLPTRFLVSRRTLDPSRCILPFRLLDFHHLWFIFQMIRLQQRIHFLRS